MKIIATSDWHLRTQKPRCRIESDMEWITLQLEILTNIVKIANKKDAPVCIVGDIFHNPYQPNKIVNMFLEFAFTVNKGIYVIAGQHDLPQHSIENMANSAFGSLAILNKSKVHIHPLFEIGMAAHWGQTLMGPNNGIYFLHRLVFPDKKSMPPNVEAITARALLEEYTDAKYIICGDNHHGFLYEGDNNYVINCGCIIRQASDFKNYKPRVYYIDTDNNEIEAIFLNDTADLVDDSYIQKSKDRDDRISAFAELIKTSTSISLDFKENVKTAMVGNKDLSSDTKTMVEKLMEGGL